MTIDPTEVIPKRVADEILRFSAAAAALDVAARWLSGSLVDLHRAQEELRSARISLEQAEHRAAHAEEQVVKARIAVQALAQPDAAGLSLSPRDYDRPEAAPMPTAE